MSHEKWGHWQFWAVFGLKKVISYWLKSSWAHRVKAQHATSNEKWNEPWSSCDWRSKKKPIFSVEEPARNVKTSMFYTDRWADGGPGSHPGRRGARCVSWPARVRADSRAGSSLSRQSQNGRGSPRGWRCCSRVPPRCPSSNWWRNIQA